MSIQGAVLGGLVTALLYARIKRVPAWELVDLCAPALALGQGLGRIGCLFEGDAFGVPISQIPWWPGWLGVTYAEGTAAWHAFGNAPLIPAEGLEALADFAIAGMLLWYRPRAAFPGWKALAYGIAYSVARFALEFFRADSLTIGGWKVAQALSVLVILACGALWVQQSGKARARKRRRYPRQLRRTVASRRAPVVVTDEEAK